MSKELGSTPDGSAWCLKALHPSDPCVQVRGIPDRSAIPSAFLNYQTLARISSPTSEPTWNFVMQCLPHPTNFAWWSLTDASGIGMGTFNAVMNSQLSGTTQTEKSVAWLNKTERWRLAYAGVTFHFDGPSLANQGTLVCSQVPYAPRSRSLTIKQPNGVTLVCPPVRLPDGTSGSDGWRRGSDFPTFESSQTMPNSYLGEVKDGLYIPIKLTKTCQQWHSSADSEMWSVDARNDGLAVGTYASAALPNAAFNMGYPFPGLPGAFVGADSSTNGGVMVPALGNDVVANVCGRNISSGSALVIEFRYGFEVQCESGTELSPFLRVSPQYDSAALKEYFAIARELKDAYPADYNDLGKLWGVIKEVAREVAPSLAMIPKFGVPMSIVARAIGGSAPAAVVQRQQDYVERTVARNDGDGGFGRGHFPSQGRAPWANAKQATPKRKAPKRAKKQISRR